MGKSHAGSWSAGWRARAHRALPAVAASGLLAALVAVPVPTALAGAASGLIAPARTTGHSGPALAQVPPGLRSAVLRTLHLRPGGEYVPDNQAGPAYEGLGYSLALSGRTALVGAIGVNNVAGAAYVYVRTGTRWGLQAVLTDPKNLPSDFFGFSVALSGDTALIGATGLNHYSGIAYVYARAGTRWHLAATLANPLGAAYDSFGRSVALAGSTAVIGAYGDADLAGAAYVYLYSGGRWHLQASLPAPAKTGGDNFGLSVAVSGSTAVIGAPGVNHSAGAAYVYVRSGTRWRLRASLDDPGNTGSDSFGWPAISGTTILVGAPGTRAAGGKTGTGAAYVYTPSRTGWALRARLADPAGTADGFGSAVAVSGGTAVVGVFDAARNYSGPAIVYVRTGSRWRRQVVLTSPVHGGIGFGFAVAVDGPALAVGAPDENFAAGAAYVYARSGARWGSQGQLVDPRGVPGAESGAAVAISGAIAVVGAWGVHHTRGAAYIDAKSAGQWRRQATLDDPRGDLYDWFGAAVAVSGSTVIVGAYGVKSVAGAVYIYARAGRRWRRQATITGPRRYDDLGASLAFSGSTLAIGAPAANNGLWDGAVYVYVRSGTHWHRQAVLDGPHGAADAFGEAVALYGGTLVVGGSGANDAAGAAFIYARSGSRWHLRAALPDPAGAPNDGFGTSVAVSGATAVIGAPGVHDFGGTAYLYGRAGDKWHRLTALTIARRANVSGGFGGAVAMSGLGRDTVALISGVSVSGLTTANRLRGNAFEFVRPGGRWRFWEQLVDRGFSPYDEFGYALAISGTTALIGAPGAHDNSGAVYVIPLRSPAG